MYLATLYNNIICSDTLGGNIKKLLKFRLVDGRTKGEAFVNSQSSVIIRNCSRNVPDKDSELQETDLHMGRGQREIYQTSRIGKWH